jgi:hypothetical protein
MGTALTRIEADQEIGMSLSLAIDPTKALEQAKKMGDAISAIIERKDKDGEPVFYQMMGKRRHAKFELWQLVAFCFGVTTRLVSVAPVVDELSGAAGFEAIVEAVHGTRIIGQAAARCLNNEDNWNMRPKYENGDGQRRKVGMVAVPSYQLESMAQTRAASKVLASHFRWVLILSGFSGTPAEEITGTEKETPEEKGAPAPVSVISDKQRKIIFGAARSRRIAFDKLPAIWQKRGFDRADQITTDKFPEIIAEIEGLGPKVEQ